MSGTRLVERELHHLCQAIEEQESFCLLSCQLEDSPDPPVILGHLLGTAKSLIEWLFPRPLISC